MMKPLPLLAVWLLATTVVQAQFLASQLDSLLNRLTVAKADTNRVKLLLELGKHKLALTGPSKGSRDSALLFFQQAQTLSEIIGDQKWKGESLCQIGTYYINEGNLARGEACFMEVIKVNQQTANKAGESEVWFKLGNSLPNKDEFFVKKLTCLTRALTLVGQLGDQHKKACILLAIGELHFEQGKLKLAESEFAQVLMIQKAIHAEKMYRTYYSLADISIYRGDLHSALSYILQAIKHLEINTNTSELDYAYYRLGYIYFTLGQFTRSIDSFEKSLAISRQKSEVIVDMALAKTMTRALLKLGEAQRALLFLQALSDKNRPLNTPDKAVLAASKGECYTALKQYRRAETYFQQCVDLSKQISQWHTFVAYVGIGRFYVTTGQYAKARPYLKQIVEVAAPQGQTPPNVLQEVHLMSFKIDSASGNYVSAIDHFRQYKALNDSLFSEAKSRQLDELQVQYETRQKEQRIQLLTEKEQRQQSELERSQTTRNGMIVGAFLLLGLLGVSYNRYRLKQQSNQLLEAKQREINQKNQSLQQVLTEKDNLLAEKEELLTEKEWMLKEIHHRVKNNLQIISSLLHSQGVYLKDQAAVSAIRESQNRVHAMALLHQKLYQADRFTAIPMAEYVEEIVDYLINSFDRQRTVRKQLAIAAVELDISSAVPLGLIINEAVTNSLKYGFPSNQQGLLCIELIALDNQTYQLTIGDNGVGLPDSFDLNKSRTLGMSLMRGLSKQLNGRLQISQSEGVQITLTFTETKIGRENLNMV